MNEFIVAEGKFTEANFRVPCPLRAARVLVNLKVVWSIKPPPSMVMSNPCVAISLDKETVLPVSISTLSFSPGTVLPI